MMLMTKFGKFKLRFIATINLSVLMSLLSMASTLTPHWINYKDHQTQPHLAGLWISCSNTGNCTWLDGMIDRWHTWWANSTRVLVGLGAIGNIICAMIFISVMWYKLHKSKPQNNVENGGVTVVDGKPRKSTFANSTRTNVIINLMEWANWILCVSFILMLVGFTIFLSSKCTLSLWFHCLGMCFMIVSSNWLTRTFATIYFQSTRFVIKNGGDHAVVSHGKLAQYTNNAANTVTDEEKQALKAFENGTANTADNTAVIEMQKLPEGSTGSKEALITKQDELPATSVNELAPLKAAASNSNINSQPGDVPAPVVVSMSASNKALNKA